MDNSKRQAFIKALLLRASGKEQNDIEIVKEPRLNGPVSANEPEANYIALYPKNIEAYQWLIEQNGAINKSGRVEPFGTFYGKVYLHDDSQKLLNGSADTFATDAFGKHRPFALSKLPSGSNATIAHINADTDTDIDSHSQALLIATPFSQQISAIDALRKDGILPKKDTLPLTYNISTNQKSGSAVIAVPIASALAQSLSANPQNAISDLRDAPNADVQKATSLKDIGSLLNLSHSEKEKVELANPPRSEKMTADTPTLPSLASKKNQLRELKLSVVRQPLLNGGIQSMLQIPATASLDKLTDAGRIADPLKVQNTLSPVGIKLYLIGKEELARLQTIIGEIASQADLPLDTKPLEKVFKAKQDNAGKLFPQITHAYFLREKTTTGVTHHVYLSGERYSLIRDIMNSLQLGNKVHYLSADNEKPTLARFTLPETAWLAFQTIAKDALGKKKLNVFEIRDDTHSLQSMDNELREALGVRLNRDPEPVPDIKSPKDPRLSKDEAIARLIDQLKAFPAEKMLLAYTRDSKSSDLHPSLYVRALTKELNRISKALKHSPDMKDAIKLVAGNKQEGQKKGLLRIALSEGLLATVTEALPSLERIDKPFEQDKANDAIKVLFEHREDSAINRDNIADAWKHLKTLDIVAVQVSAPNKSKLVAIENKIKDFIKLREQFALLPETFDTLAQTDRTLLKALRKNGEEDAAITKILKEDIALARKTSEQLQEGLYTRIEARIETLRNEYDSIKAKGVHTEYVVLNPEVRSQKLLQPLLENGVLKSLYQPTHAKEFLRFTPSAPAQFTDMVKQHAVFIKNSKRGAEFPLISVDKIEEWAAKMKATFAAKAFRERPTTVIHGASAATNISNVAEKEPSLALEVSGDSSKSIQKHLAKLSGLLTWERQVPSDANLPTQASIGKQAVLAISVATQKELNSFKLLHQRLQDADLLLETPRFYGEIKSAKVCTPKKEENVAETISDSEEKISALYKLESFLDTIIYQQKTLNNSGKTEEERAFAENALNDAKKEMKTWLTENLLSSTKDSTIVTLRSPVWRAALESEDYVAASKSLRAEIKNLEEQQQVSEPAQPRRNLSAPKSTDNYIVSVLKGNSDLAYPVDGRAGSGKDDYRFDTWRQYILRPQTKGIPALKLYLKPEAVSLIAELMENGRSQISNQLESSENKPATADDVASKLFHIINPSRISIIPLESSKIGR